MAGWVAQKEGVVRDVTCQHKIGSEKAAKVRSKVAE